MWDQLCIFKFIYLLNVKKLLPITIRSTHAVINDHRNGHTVRFTKPMTVELFSLYIYKYKNIIAHRRLVLWNSADLADTSVPGEGEEGGPVLRTWSINFHPKRESQSKRSESYIRNRTRSCSWRLCWELGRGTSWDDVSQRRDNIWHKEINWIDCVCRISKFA